MLLPTHIAVGYVFSKTYCEVLGQNCGSESLFTTIAIATSVLPDIDIFFGKKVNNHRNTIFHSPLFWLLLAFLLFLVIFFKRNYNLGIYTIAGSFGVFSHIFLDWFSGRTIGIRIFYPFSKKMYSLFALNPQIGNIPIIPSKKYIHKYIHWIEYYFKNAFLVITELTILIIFFIVIIFKR